MTVEVVTKCNRPTIRTRDAFVISLVVLTVGFIFSTFKSGPYAEFAAAVVAVFSGYGYKRLKQRAAQYQPENGECTEKSPKD
jgi:4-hydroxybenzoate polyprenyltransferase